MKTVLTSAQASKALIDLLNAKDPLPITETEGIVAQATMVFKPKFVGVVVENGEVERLTKPHPKFGQSKFITALFDKATEGEDLPKPLKIVILETQAPKIYEKLVAAHQAQKEAGGLFPEFTHTGEDFEIGRLKPPKMFYIPDTTTKSGWSEDKQGRPVPQSSRPYIFCKDLHGDIETMMRREVRNLEIDGHFVDSTAPSQIPEVPNNTNDPKIPVQTEAQKKADELRIAAGAPQVADPNFPGYDVNAVKMAS